MKAAIYGAGGMGTILGAYITKAGYEIDLINHNKEHIEGLKRNGAHIVGMIDFIQPVSALLPEEMERRYDVILLMTKQMDNKKIVEGLVPFLSNDGVICTMQNGLPELSVSEVIGKDRTIGCTMSWGATFIGKGVAELTSEPTRETMTFSIGKFGNNDQKHFAYIVEILNTMGEVKIEENFIGARWSKLLINAAFSGLSVITGANFGEIAKNKKSRLLALKVIKECIDVAKASDIKIEPLQGKDVVKLMDYHNNFKRWISLRILPIAMKKHKRIKSSMLRDLERGRKCEIDAINGVVCKYGDMAQIETPINDRIVEITHQIENTKSIPEWKNIELLYDLL
ncbi:MAG: 2-dehydropantoate 2-reductase [Bacilli bacterium]|nr:2-dehydropantoate 2-reductase [Bacilli bacterium]MBN2876859.1 2-dehydropantoate 2-reductase [Bacilli bacterium]